MKDLTLPTPDLQAVRDETIASGQHKDLIRACSLAGLSYADCMRIVAYMPVLSHHEDGGRAATDKKSARDTALEQAANLVECEYAENATQDRRLKQIAQHIRDLKKRNQS